MEQKRLIDGVPISLFTGMVAGGAVISLVIATVVSIKGGYFSFGALINNLIGGTLTGAILGLLGGLIGGSIYPKLGGGKRALVLSAILGGIGVLIPIIILFLVLGWMSKHMLN